MMRFFSDDEHWDLQGRGSSLDLFVDSCLHLLSPTAALNEERHLAPNVSVTARGNVRVAFVGIGLRVMSMARPERRGDNPRPISLFDYSPDGFRVKIEVNEDQFPGEEFFASFALDVTFANRELNFRISKATLDAMVAEWLARRPTRSDAR